MTHQVAVLSPQAPPFRLSSLPSCFCTYQHDSRRWTEGQHGPVPEKEGLRRGRIRGPVRLPCLRRSSAGACLSVRAMPSERMKEAHSSVYVTAEAKFVWSERAMQVALLNMHLDTVCLRQASQQGTSSSVARPRKQPRPPHTARQPSTRAGSPPTIDLTGPSKTGAAATTNLAATTAMPVHHGGARVSQAEAVAARPSPPQNLPAPSSVSTPGASPRSTHSAQSTQSSGPKPSLGFALPQVGARSAGKARHAATDIPGLVPAPEGGAGAGPAAGSRTPDPAQVPAQADISGRDPQGGVGAGQGQHPVSPTPYGVPGGLVPGPGAGSCALEPAQGVPAAAAVAGQTQSGLRHTQTSPASVGARTSTKRRRLLEAAGGHARVASISPASAIQADSELVIHAQVPTDTLTPTRTTLLPPHVADQAPQTQAPRHTLLAHTAEPDHGPQVPTHTGASPLGGTTPLPPHAVQSDHGQKAQAPTHTLTVTGTHPLPPHTAHLGQRFQVQAPTHTLGPANQQAFQPGHPARHASEQQGLQQDAAPALAAQQQGSQHTVGPCNVASAPSSTMQLFQPLPLPIMTVHRHKELTGRI